MRRLAAIVLVMVCAGLGTSTAQDTTGPEIFSGELAFEHVANQVAVGPRPTATENSYEAGNLIIDYLEGLGWEVSEDWHLLDFGPESALGPEARQTLEDWQPVNAGGAVEAAIEAAAGDIPYGHVLVPVRNIVATYGEGPAIILGAHYDTRIYADQDKEAPETPVLGANDAGSGVGVLLELARVISENYVPNVQIRLVFFDAEDNGNIPPWTSLPYSGSGYIIGSTLYANNLDLSLDPVLYMILVDMVGDTNQVFPMEGHSIRQAPEVVMGLWNTAASLGYGEQFPFRTRSGMIDDHVPFIQRGVPAVDIIDFDYPQWHTTEDTLENVSAESLERVGRVLQAFLQQTGAIVPIG